MTEPTTEYTAIRPCDGEAFQIFDVRLAEQLSKDGWRLTAVTQ